MAFTLIAITLISCRKTDIDYVSDSIPIWEQSVVSQRAYVTSNLKTIGKQLAKLSKYKNFRNYIHSKVKEQRHGDYEVLIETILKDPTWSDKLNSESVKTALKAFQNIDGCDYYPQIYIPRFQDFDENSLSSLRIDEEEPVLIFYDGNESYTQVPGYVMDANGNLTDVGFPITETYANEHEVWVLSLSEYQVGRITYQDEIESGEVGGGTGSYDFNPLEQPTTSPTPPDLGHFKVNCKIEDMIVKAHVESWLAGGSEVAIRAKLTYYNDRELGYRHPAPETYYRSDQYSTYLGKMIKRFKRKQIKNETLVHVNYVLQTNWENEFPYVDPIFFNYVIFERDIWPTGLNETTFAGKLDPLLPQYYVPQWAKDWKYKFRSNPNDPFYSGGWICNNSMYAASQNEYSGTHITDNTFIAYNTIHY